MKVLICVDYSTYTRKILEGAKAILGNRLPQPEISVLYVIDESLLFAGTGGEQEALKGLQDNGRQINKMAKQYLGDTINYIEEYGIPRVEIDEVIANNSYDLLVFGTRGQSAFTKLLLGSEAEHLLHHAKIPVLIIP